MKLINKEVRIENCSLCNSRCIICPREKMTRKQMVMSNEKFENLVDQSVELGAETISVFGYGEPLLDKGIVDKIRYCNLKGLKTFITTNASLLNVDMAHNLLKAGLRHIRFSVHGIYDKYEKVHRGLKWNDTARNIGNFTAMSRTKFPNQCKISISIIPMHDENIDEIKHIWRKFDIEIWKPHNWGGSREYRKLTKERKKTCGRPFSGPVQILADGKMIVCCFDPDGIMVVGDTNKNTIKEILKSDSFNFIRSRHESGDMSGLLCENCDQLNIGDNPLLYSTIDPTCTAGKTSSTKFNLEERNDLFSNENGNDANSCGACCN